MDRKKPNGKRETHLQFGEECGKIPASSEVESYFLSEFEYRTSALRGGSQNISPKECGGTYGKWSRESYC